MIDPEVTNVPKLDNGEEKQAEEKKNKMMMMTKSEITKQHQTNNKMKRECKM